jgi:hypothetical protein
VERVESRRFARRWPGSHSPAAGVQLLIGLGAVPGRLGPHRCESVQLSLIAVLAVGYSDVLSGTSIACRTREHVSQVTTVLENLQSSVPPNTPGGKRGRRISLR